MTDFMTKLMLVTTAELTAFALTFSFSRPASRETLYIEIFLLTQEIFIGVAGYVVWMRSERNYKVTTTGTTFRDTSLTLVLQKNANLMKQVKVIKVVTDAFGGGV
jgi:hypothetical protein